MSIELRPLHPRSWLLQEAVRVYCTVWERAAPASLAFFRAQARLPLFLGCIALDNGRGVGFAFGTASLPGQWWHDTVAEHVGAQHPALQEAWVLTEIAVLAAYRGRGLGAVLHDTVLRRQPLPNVLLSTQQSNRRAQRFYARHGWSLLHPGFSFHEGRPPYVIMHRYRSHAP